MRSGKLEPYTCPRGNSREADLTARLTSAREPWHAGPKETQQGLNNVYQRVLMR